MAMRLSYQYHNESTRWRLITGIRLSLGGAALGTALAGVGGLIFGYQTHVGIDVSAAIAGGAMAAIYIFFGFNDH